MEEKEKKMEEALKPEAEKQQFLAKLEIVMLPNGEIGLKAPVGNKPLCKALLAAASEIIDGYKPNIIPIRSFNGPLNPGGRG